MNIHRITRTGAAQAAAARTARRGLLRRAAVAAGAAVVLAGPAAWAAGPAAAIPGPVVLYAYAGGAAVSPTSCPQDTASPPDPSVECSLAEALSLANPGDTIDLATPGTTHYVGNWTVSTSNTSATAPVTIEPAPGLASQPVLDGNNGVTNSKCTTAACNRPVLTVQAGQFVVLTGITITNANNSRTAGGGGLFNYGTVTITGCTFTGNTAENGIIGAEGGAIDSADNGGGSVTVTASTFTGNSADIGGAIASGLDTGAGSVTVTASTFTGNTAGFGGAIASGDTSGGGTTVSASTFTNNTGELGGGAISSGGGTMTVSASTFSGNTAAGNIVQTGDGGAIDNTGGSVTVTASTFTGNSSGDGGAIDSGDDGGGGTVQVTASTFSGNTATSHGNTIDNGDNGGLGSVAVAGDVFSGSSPACDQAGGTWTDGGYNAGTDTTCFKSTTPPVSDKSASTVGSDLQTTLTDNGGPTKTIAPTTGNPAIGLITNPTTGLCPAVDQRGYATAGGAKCDAGAVQTTGSPPALALKDSAAPASFNAAGQVITYSYQVANTGAGTLSGITVADPAVPGVSCPSATLPPGTRETCTGTYTVTAADLAAGKITDTATAAGATADGVPVAPASAAVTVPRGWPPLVTGTHRPAAGGAEGYYLGVTTASAWSVFVTHPGTAKVSFTGKVRVPAGSLRHLTLINPLAGHQVAVKGRVITFTLPDHGKVTGFRFTTGTKVTSITFTLNIGGHPATASQIFLGGTPAHPATGSPLTFTR